MTKKVEIERLEEIITLRESQLAECYRLTGSDPSGGRKGEEGEDWRLADKAVQAVTELRQSDTALEDECLGYETKIVELSERLEISEANAARYQYLRSQPESYEPNRIDVVYWVKGDETCNDGTGLRGEALDEAIDTACLREKRK